MAERIKLTRRRQQTTKPLLERQRRARINRSLEELKSLVLSALYHDNDHNSQKMEKAEILELTVNFLKMIRGQQLTGYWNNPQSEPESQHSNNRAGFNECAGRVRSFVENQPGVNPKLQEQILGSLAASYSFNFHTNQTLVNKSTSVSFPPGQAVYVSGLQTTAESPCTCAFTPPPSPPLSSAFRPYDRRETTTLTDASGNSPENCYSTADIKRSMEEPCKLSLWRPWIQSSQQGQI